jgi:prepilin-type processing-associated H-X9-DG protein
VSLPVAILAGGLGTRLGPLSERTPKSLIEVAGKPFILHQLELLRQHELTRVVLCVGHFGEMIQAVIGDGHALGMRIQYIFDGDIARGTGGAVKQALPVLGKAFFVLYGDSYLRIDYRAMEAAFNRCEKLGMMSVYRNCGKWDHSNVLYADGRVVSYDKRGPSPSAEHIDYGLSLLREEAFTNIPDAQPCDLAAVFQRLIAKNQMAGFEVFERFYEIGSVAGLEETRAFLSSTL